jgi:hypothetical protein
MDDFLARAGAMTLEGHLDRIRVPFLVTHGAKDRQIAVEYADGPTTSSSTRHGAS